MNDTAAILLERIEKLEAAVAQLRWDRMFVASQQIAEPDAWPVIDPSMLPGERMGFEPFNYTERS